MTVLLSPVGGVAAQFFDNNGNPLSGGKLFSYAAGTTTPAATYTSSLGTTAHTNPIVLDAGGRVPGGEIWLSDNVIYKFVLQTSTNVLIATYDNIVGINSNFVNYTTEQEIQTATAGQTVFNLTTVQYQPGTNSLSVYVDGVNQYGPGAQYAYLETDTDTVTFVSGLHVGASVKFTTATQVTGNATDASVVSYTPPFINSVTTTVEDKLAQTVSVKDFGAVGDGVADDTAAIQDAIDASANLYFPSGTYLITSQIDVSAGKTIRGYGATLKPGTNGMTMMGNNGTFLSSLILEGLEFSDYDGTTTNVSGLTLSNTHIGVVLRDLGFTQLTNGITLSTSYEAVIENPRAFRTPNPVIINSGAVQISHPMFDNTAEFASGSNTGNGIRAIGRVVCSGGYIQGFDYGVNDSAESSAYSDIYFERCTESAFYFNNAISPAAYDCIVFGFAGKSAIKVRNTKSGKFYNNKMTTGGATIGLYDSDTTNENCYGDKDYISATINNNLGATAGIITLGDKYGPYKDGAHIRDVATNGVAKTLFTIKPDNFSVTSCEIDVQAIETTAPYFASVKRKFVFVITRDTVSTNSAVTQVAAWDYDKSNSNWAISAAVALSLNGSGNTVVSVTFTSTGALTWTTAAMSASLKVDTTSLNVVITPEF